MSRTKSTIARPNAETLRALYVDQQLGCPAIGHMFERDAKTVHYWLRQAGIPTRARGTNPGPQFKLGQRSAFSGRKHSDESRALIGAASIGRAWRSGADHWLHGAAPEDNPNWKGGLTPERQEFYRMPEWKACVRAVWARSEGHCERCCLAWKDCDPETTPTFHVHHVISFQIRETRAMPHLLVLLCRPCHLFVHSKANVTREYLPQMASGPDGEFHWGELRERSNEEVDHYLASQRRMYAAYNQSMSRNFKATA